MKFMTHDDILNEFYKKSFEFTEANSKNVTIPLNDFFNWEAIEKQNVSSDKMSEFKTILPGKVDLRKFDCEVEEQEGPRCTAWSLSHAMSNMLTQKTGLPTDLSEAHVWSKYGVYSCERAISALNKIENRVCDEIYWPSISSNRKSGIEQNKHAWVKRFTYIGTNTIKMQDALAAGKVVYLALQVPSDMSAGKAVIHPESKATKGGHAVIMVGYERDERVPGGVYAIIKNSWGTRTGDLGYQYFPIEHYAQSRKDCYVIMWVLDEVESIRDVAEEEKVCVEWKRLWYKPWQKICTKYASS